MPADNESPDQSTRTLLISSGLLILFAAILGIVVAGTNVLEFDIDILRSIQQWQGSLPESLYRTGDMLGGTITAIVVVVVLLVLSAIQKSGQFMVFFVATGLLRMLALTLKPIFNSPRPSIDIDDVLTFDLFDGTGYPSGHSMSAAMIAALLVVITWAITNDTLQRGLMVVISAGIMLLVGWSRVWSGAHWPTDVLGGWAVGIAIVLIAWVIAIRFAAARTGQGSAPAQE